MFFSEDSLSFFRVWGCGGRDSFKDLLIFLNVFVFNTHEFRIPPKLQTLDPLGGVTGSCGLL